MENKVLYFLSLGTDSLCSLNQLDFGQIARLKISKKQTNYRRQKESKIVIPQKMNCLFSLTILF